MTPLTTLLIFESEIDKLVLELKSGVIRMAGNADRPFDPLRPNKEVILDGTGQYVLPDKDVGISLAGNIDKLKLIWRTGRENHLFVIDRTTRLEEGFAFNSKDPSHWIILSLGK